MFAFGLNLVCALIYGVVSIRFGSETPTFIVWAGGMHAGLAFSLAAVMLAERGRA